MTKLAIVGAVLAAMLSTPAQAGPRAPLPAIMLGEWCQAYGTTLFTENAEPLGRAYTHSREEEGVKCDAPLTVSSTGYSTSQQHCRFLTMQPIHRDETIVMRGTARCAAKDGQEWSASFDLDYYKTSLTLTLWR
jgi:hypothetical protein